MKPSPEHAGTSRSKAATPGRDPTPLPGAPSLRGSLALVLHAHLPFVRHPEHEKFFEESWLFEAMAECYLPILEVLEGWEHDHVPARITLSLSPTLCSMLQDQLLQKRFENYLDGRIELAAKEARRTLLDPPFQEMARFYQERLTRLRRRYEGYGRNLVAGFRKLQDCGRIEIITCAATHAVLPLLANHPPSVRAQLQVARDHYRTCFGRPPHAVWLPECAYFEGLDEALHAAGLRWCILDTHGLLHAHPRPRYGMFAPIVTPAGVAAFGRDIESAKQVWSRDEGYPGDPEYRDFYRDIGYDLEADYVRPYLPGGDQQRGFTGLKYHRITGRDVEKQVYRRAAALERVERHAEHFLAARLAQFHKLGSILDRAPIVVSPYDAELYGHWWYEGPDFLDALARKAVAQQTFALLTPSDYLRANSLCQEARPAPSSWGEEGHLGVWLNEKNHWVLPQLQTAQERMTELVEAARRKHGALLDRALRQAGRELLLAQASDWPFILRTGTSPDYARHRITVHLERFNALYDQIHAGHIEAKALAGLEQSDNLFPDLDYRYWRRE